jgi:hypothetical protein
MSSTWFNLRIFLWHIQILKGRLFRPTISFNPFWWRKELLWKPIWFHEFNPKEGWRLRGSRQWLAYETGQKGGV